MKKKNYIADRMRVYESDYGNIMVINDPLCEDRRYNDTGRKLTPAERKKYVKAEIRLSKMCVHAGEWFRSGEFPLTIQ